MRINYDLLYKIMKWMLGIMLLAYFVVAFHYFRRAFIADQFVIPTHSMEPTLIPGDRVIVNKFIFGARIYEEFNFFDDEPIKTYRTRGYRGIHHNDVVAFNIPRHGGEIKFRINKVFAKRCIGLSGDTVSAVNGFFHNNNYTGNGSLGYYKAQQQLSATPDSMLHQDIKNTIYTSEQHPWTIKNFGPIYVPRRGDVVNISPSNIKFYKEIIEYETNKKISVDSSKVLLNNSPLPYYTFADNYYFMVGDNVLNSSDSRYWGFAPEEFIIGVISHITYSKDKYTGEFRWNRLWKKIKTNDE